MEKKSKNISLKGNQHLEKNVQKALDRKEQVKKLIKQGASIDQIRKIAPLS